MEHSRTKLARLLNDLVEAGRVAVTESGDGSIAISQLSGAEAEEALQILEAGDWFDIHVTDEGGDVPREMLPQASGGVRLSARGVAPPSGVRAFVTASGFDRLLSRPSSHSCIWVEGLSKIVDTLSVRYAPWGTTEAFEPSDQPPTPARVVRPLNGSRLQADIGRWLMSVSEEDVSDAALAPWRSRAATALLTALAQEIEPADELLFRGPPPTRFITDGANELTGAQFEAMQRAAGWVYANERELENRHTLLAVEVARTSLRSGTLVDLASSLDHALEGAKIAYSFGVTQQSKDTLRALTDLRKAIADDTAKLSEVTRAISTAVVGAVFANISLIVARLTIAPNAQYVGLAALILAGVLALYVVSMISTGAHYVSIQRQLRHDWKDRLYRFLPSTEYKRMVEDPAARAERGFKFSVVAAVLMIALSTFAVYHIAYAGSYPSEVSVPATSR